MADHIWQEAGTWECYSKGYQRGGKEFRCSRCGCVVRAGPKGDIRDLDLDEAAVNEDCNVQVVVTVMSS